MSAFKVDLDIEFYFFLILISIQFNLVGSTGTCMEGTVMRKILNPEFLKENKWL